MNNQDTINRYDLVEVIRVPEQYEGMIDIGDIGVVVETYDDENFEIECVTPDGSYKWLETLNGRYLSKHLQSLSRARGRAGKSLMHNSVRLGSLVGTGCGALMGGGLGAITGRMNGILVGLLIGILLGLITGAVTAALTVKTAGTTGGVGVGYYTGTVFGGVFGIILGALIPTSIRMRAHTEGMPVLDALAIGRFETAVLGGFLLSILATIVGVWVGGRNVRPRNLRKE